MYILDLIQYMKNLKGGPYEYGIS